MHRMKVEYCGLFLYIMTGNKDIRSTFQENELQDKNLVQIYDLVFKKEEGKSITSGIQDLKKTMKSPDLVILLSLLETCHLT